MELHTFSSLNADFLPQYKGCMASADQAVVFFNPEVVRHKKLPEITTSDVKKDSPEKNWKCSQITQPY